MKPTALRKVIWAEKCEMLCPMLFCSDLTGTPINKADKNTFWAFGAEQDKGGYMSRYTFQESIRDNATLPFILNHGCPIIISTKKVLMLLLKNWQMI